MSDESFAVLRFGKIKSLAQFRAALNHNYRKMPVRHLCNNNPIEELKGSFDLSLPLLKSKLPEKIRKNGVIAIEVLLSASPQFFRPNRPDEAGEYDDERYDAFKSCALSFLAKSFPNDNVISIVAHKDESTIHFHCMLSCNTPDGRYSASDFIGTPEKLRNLQSQFAEDLKHLGINRGISSKITNSRHVPIARFYSLFAKFGFNAVLRKVKKRVFTPVSDFADSLAAKLKQRRKSNFVHTPANN